MPDLSWLRTADADTLVPTVIIGVVIAAGVGVLLWAAAVRLTSPAVRRRARRAARWVAARWEAHWQGCPQCDHCLARRRDAARTRWAAIPRPRHGGTP